ncbi:hypothetical protein ACFXHA_33290 [Nocardia sp. NPDC059240]|uniref:hypothetical protein n=1 Tax=Nocardia sp. NPDC059240 TaxID=3346786 RepID=UPI00369D1478
MPARLDRKISPRRYRDYTGTPHQRIVGDCRIDRENPIPAAVNPDQQALESLVFARLADCREVVPNPFGVKRVILPTDYRTPTTLHVVDTMYGLETTESYAGWLLQSVLPHAVDESGYSNGVADVRIVCAGRRELVLTLVGTDARLRFRGGPRTDFARAVAEFQQLLISGRNSAVEPAAVVPHRKSSR